jgi:uncharacterized coiled-coil DUF342 family protein
VHNLLLIQTHRPILQYPQELLVAESALTLQVLREQASELREQASELREQASELREQASELREQASEQVLEPVKASVAHPEY